MQPMGNANFHARPNAADSQDLARNLVHGLHVLQTVRRVQVAADAVRERQDALIEIPDKIRSRQNVYIQPIRQTGSAAAAQLDSLHLGHTSALQYSRSYKSAQSSRKRQAASSLAA